jgi:hypothetical protein
MLRRNSKEYPFCQNRQENRLNIENQAGAVRYERPKMTAIPIGYNGAP